MIIEAKQNAEYRQYTKRWQFCIGSCHAPMAQRVDYNEQLRFIHEELGIERVRFHGLFNDDMNVAMSMTNFIKLPMFKKYSQNSFFQIGRIYDNILRCGMKPFVELSFMPSLLASGRRKCGFKYGGSIAMPADLKKWSELITEFLNFLIDRYGADEVRQWYFEVWNEPNLGVFFAGSMKDYFELYKAAATAVKRVDAGIRVGGPATASTAWIDEFTAYIHKEYVPCDFISTHQYPTDEAGVSVTAMALPYIKRVAAMRKSSGGTVLEGVRALFGDDSAKIRDRDFFLKNAASVKEKASGLPVIYSEWNVSAVNTAEINDTRAAAAFVTRTVMKSDGLIDGLSLWCFSDLFEEIEFFPEPFCGGFGLLDVYGIPKPSFYALKLLNMAEGMYYTGECDGCDAEYAVFKSENAVRLLIWDQCFSPRDGEVHEVRFKTEAVSRPKKVSIFKIDESHCNPLRVWREMGSPEVLKPADVDYITSRSSLTGETLEFRYENGTVYADTLIGSNEIQMIAVEL